MSEQRSRFQPRSKILRQANAHTSRTTGGWSSELRRRG
jgi:hypothetical protein